MTTQESQGTNFPPISQKCKYYPQQRLGFPAAANEDRYFGGRVESHFLPNEFTASKAPRPMVYTDYSNPQTAITTPGQQWIKGVGVDYQQHANNDIPLQAGPHVYHRRDINYNHVPQHQEIFHREIHTPQSHPQVNQQERHFPDVER